MAFSGIKSVIGAKNEKVDTPYWINIIFPIKVVLLVFAIKPIGNKYQAKEKLQIFKYQI